MQDTIDLVKKEINENNEIINNLSFEREELIQRLSEVQICINKRRSTERGLKNDLKVLYSNQSESLKMKEPDCNLKSTTMASQPYGQEKMKADRPVWNNEKCDKLSDSDRLKEARQG